MKSAFVDSSQFDYGNVVVDKDAIGKINPHRHELALLDGILLLSHDFAVGFKDIQEDAFWVRGHFPDKPIMPGVLVCECAAQLSCYFAMDNKMVDNGGYVGLGGLEGVRFRGPVVPGDRLVVMLRRGKVRKNAMFTAEFQGWVNDTLVVDGLIKGIVLNDG